MEQPGFDRRKRQRRRGENDVVNNLFINRRGENRREKTRRQYPRVVYPLSAAPQILNLRSQVVGISAKAIRFFFSDFDPQIATLKIGAKIKISLKFHDGQTYKLIGTILRRDQYQEEKEHFVCLFQPELSPERIEKELTYLQKKFPDISSDDLWDSPSILFFD